MIIQMLKVMSSACSHHSHHASSASAALGNKSLQFLTPTARLMHLRSQVQSDDAERRRKALRYTCSADRLATWLRPLFVYCPMDKEGDQYLQGCENSLVKTLLAPVHAVGYSVLSRFLSKTSVNGVLHRGSMYILSTHHFHRLLTFGNNPPAWARTTTTSSSSSPFSLPSTSSSSSMKSSDVCASPTAVVDMPPLEDTPSPKSTASSPNMSLSSSFEGGDALMDIFPKFPSAQFNTLLDVGAGDGNVTEKIARLARNTTATEASTVMTWRLWRRGFRALNVLDLSSPELQPTYDVVACLNVLDRCSRPISLLQSLKEKLEPENGRLIIAVVYPFRPYVEFSEKKGTHAPLEVLDVGPQDNWENFVNDFATNVFQKHGFRVHAFTRTPYISDGDTHSPYYVLENAVFVLSDAKYGAVAQDSN